MIFGRLKKIRITTWRIVALATLNLTVFIHYYTWHVLEQHTVGHSDPREYFEFFRTGVARPFAVLFLVVSVLTLFFGRFFCAWACHMGSWQDTARYLGDRKWKRFIPLHTVATLALPALCLALPFIGVARHWSGNGLPSSVHFEWSDLPVLDVTAEGVVISLALLVLINQALFGSRAICRFFCPLALWMKAIDAFSRMRLRRTRNATCEANCLQCNTHCRMGVDVNYQVNRFGEVRDLQCIKCGTCTVYCPHQKLKLTRRPVGAELIVHPDHAPNLQRWVKKPVEWVIHGAAVILIILALPDVLDAWEHAMMMTCVAMVSVAILYRGASLFFKRLGRAWTLRSRAHEGING